MRRPLLFVVLGPPLGLFVAFWLLVPAINWALADPGDEAGWSEPDYHNLVLLPLAYFFGAVPALLCGLLDGWMARRAARGRVALTALFGFCGCFLPFASLLAMGRLDHPIVLLYGLVGGAPAAACSYLSGRLWPQRKAA